MRLIDADIADVVIIYDKGNELMQVSAIREYIKRQKAFLDKFPTIDAVPVVRCRECKHHRDKNEHERQYLAEGVLICTSPEATDDCWNAVWPDHFCSYGKRKEGADNG